MGIDPILGEKEGGEHVLDRSEIPPSYENLIGKETDDDEIPSGREKRRRVPRQEGT